MHARKLLRTVAAFIVAFTFACGLIPNSLSPKSPTPTEFPQFDSIFPPEAPTPLSTVLPSLPPVTFIETKVTNSDGKVVFEDNNSSVNLNVQVQDTNTNSPLEGIQIQVLSYGKEFLIIALDPNKEYLPYAKSVQVTSSRENDTYEGFGVYPVYAQTGLEIALFLTKVVDWYQTSKSAYEFFTDFPDIKRFSLWYGDLCFTGEQLANYFGYSFGVATALVPIPKGSTEAEKQFIKAIFDSVNQGVGSDADLYLRSLPDTYLIRVHSFPKPKLADAKTTAISLVGLEYLGLCESAPVPTETTNKYQLPRSLSTIPVLSDGTVDFNATPVIASISELSKIYLDLPYSEKIEPSLSFSFPYLEISISSIDRQTEPYVLKVNLQDDGFPSDCDFMRQGLINAAATVFSWLRLHGVQVKDVYIAWNWNYGDFNQEKAERWLGSFEDSGMPERCEPSTASEETNEFNLKNYPDMFVSNLIPFRVHDFSLESEYVPESESTGHFRLNVSLESANVEESKEGLITWLVMSGLTEEQIEQLDMNYVDK